MDCERFRLELPALSASAPRRLLIFLHGAGSSPEEFAPFARRWQLKFPGATAALMRGLQLATTGSGLDFYDGRGTSSADRLERIERAAAEVGEQIAAVQQANRMLTAQTVLIGFSQGATLALELARHRPDLAGIVVAYAARLARPIAPGERVNATVHLIHGEFDSWVPAVHATQALRGLRAIDADVTLDLVAGASHAIGSDMLALGTTRVMRTVFRGRTPARPGVRGPLLH